MSHPTTISLTVRAVATPSQTLPGVSLRLKGQRQDHQFTRSMEEHRVTVCAELEEGAHTLFLHYLSSSAHQGSVEIVKMHIQGMPIGRPMYDGIYHAWDDPDTHQKGQLTMQRPGSWRYTIGVPTHTKHYGVGFA